MSTSRTKTYSYGSSIRENHDATPFYARNLFAHMPILSVEGLKRVSGPQKAILPKPLELWADKVYCQTATEMTHIPDESIALALTSPPYNAGKTFDKDLDLLEYFQLIRDVAAEVYRVLKPGGRYVVNITNLGRKPYVPVDAYFYAIHMGVQFLPLGSVVWQKARGANGSCAWGSWCSAKAPQLRDIHEMLLVFCKGRFNRPDIGESDISPEEFMAATLSVWQIPPESAKRVGHPAPFPVALASRIIQLFSYRDDVVLDPFNGSGTTCVAAVMKGRHFVGYDVSREYCDLAEKRISEARGKVPANPPNMC